MFTVRMILDRKGHQVWSTHPQATVFEALQIMQDKDIGALVIMDGERLAGIFSERDYARKVVLRGRSSQETQVGEIMTADVVTIRPEVSTEECMALMTERRIRHLPVLEEGRLIGLISIGDVVKAVISNQEFVIEQLENYISGDR